MDDIILNKSAAIQRCLSRIKAVYNQQPGNFRTDHTAQDSILLNLQRACEASIDLANHIIKRDFLGLPQNSKEAFDLLVTAGKISRELGERMKRMVGFRNLAVPEYQTLDLGIVESIIQNHLSDFLEFTSVFLKA